MNAISAKAWKGQTYGIRIGRTNAHQYFNKNFRTVQIDIDGQNHIFSLSDTFWTTCPEIRGKAIGDFLMRRGLIPWPKWKPPALQLLQKGNCQFKLEVQVP